MTKQEILDRFKDINEAYNDSSRYDSLSRMLDELLKERAEENERLKTPTAGGNHIPLRF